MKHLAIVAVLLATSVACDDSNQTGPSTPPSTYTFAAQLSPSNEVPPVTNADGTASGTTTVTLNVTRDGTGTITGGTVDIRTTVTGFSATTTVVAGHIHKAPAGTNAAVVVGQFGPGEFVLTGGAGSLTKNGLAIPAADAQGLVDSPTGYYFNVHTALNPGGAIRGQLGQTQ
jgi:hypothetical protein